MWETVPHGRTQCCRTGTLNQTGNPTSTSVVSERTPGTQFESRDLGEEDDTLPVWTDRTTSFSLNPSSPLIKSNRVSSSWA